MSSASDRFINREAQLLVIVLAGLVILAYALGATAAGHGLSLFTLLVIYLARNPHCHVPAAPLGVVSPVHGRVVSAGRGVDPYLEREALHVRIRMSPWHAHILRSPTEGGVEETWMAGKRRIWTVRRHALHLRTDEGDDVVLVFNLGLLAPLARVCLAAGDRTGQGHRCGFIYFCADLDIYLRPDSRLECAAGNVVRAGSSLLGHFTH